MVMGLERKRDANDGIGSDCSICLEPLVNKDDDRTLVKLRCDHQFHLDCIGSAFNAKNKMQCPNCRNVEQGRWLYATGLPNSDFNAENWVPEAHRGLATNLAFGMEICPFQAFGQLNPSAHSNMLGPNRFSHEPGHNGSELCPYIEYTIPVPQSRYAVDVLNPYGLLVDQLSPRSNTSPLIPHRLLPTNPRTFMSVSEPGVTRVRHYFSHPPIDPGHIGGFNTSMATVPVVPPYPGGSLVANSAVANVPLVPPYLGSSLVSNALLANAPMALHYLGGNLLANAPMNHPYLGSNLVGNAPVVPPYLGNNMMPIDQIHQLLMGNLASFPSLMGSLSPPAWHGHLPNSNFIGPLLHRMMYGGGSISGEGSGSGSGSDGRGSGIGGESGSGNSVIGGSSRSDGNGGSNSNGGDESRSG